jgi:hypothetical protein
MARPVKISDAEVLRVIAEVRQRDRVVRGTTIRDELRRRLGVRGGTQRIYRLLSEPSAATARADSGGDARVAELEAALAAALHRAELAEHRERAHQDKWANELYELRHEVQGLRTLRRR